MNKIDELIEKLCPNGVEYKILQDVCDSFPKGTLKTTELIDSGKYPVINSGRTFYGNYDKYNNEKNALIFAARGEYAGFITYIDTKFWAGGLCYPYRSKNERFITTKFIYYYLKNNEKSIMKKLVTRGGIPAINKSDIDKIKIAVPPLEIQNEIVSILDKFTELLALLKAELKARKKQYEYYREYLLTFGDEISRKKLIDIANISRGKRVTKQECNEKEKYPVYQNSLAPMGYYKEYNYEKNKTYVISAGSAGEIGFCEENFWAADDCLVIYDLEEVLDKYVYYYLRFKQDYIRASVRKASIPRLPREIIENIEIPIVSIEEQEKIVNILEKFDKLCNSLCKGIPAEIEARQTQYEYYRDKLLTFKELVIDE